MIATIYFVDKNSFHLYLHETNDVIIFILLFFTYVVSVSILKIPKPKKAKPCMSNRMVRLHK